MSQSLIALAAVAAFLVVFPLFWMGIVWLIGKIGGWSTLFAQFPATEAPKGKAFGWRSVRLDFFGSYSHSMNVTVSGDGIHMEPVAFFRFGHPPVFIPWEAVARMHINIFGLFSSADLRLTPRVRGEAIKLKLYGEALVQSLEKHGVKEQKTAETNPAG